MAPVKEPKNVLGVCTGTGIWAMEFAEKRPETAVVGTDLSRIQREPSLPSISFIEQDAEKDNWEFSQIFDYIHWQYVVLCFDDTRVVMQKSFDQLNSGGWIEFLDLEIQMLSHDDSTRGSAIEQWSKELRRAPEFGRDLEKCNKYKEWLEETSFVDIIDQPFHLTSSSWPKRPRLNELGEYQYLCMSDVFAAGKFLNVSWVDQDTFDGLVPWLQRQLHDTNIRFYWRLPIV